MPSDERWKCHRTPISDERGSRERVPRSSSSGELGRRARQTRRQIVMFSRQLRRSNREPATFRIARDTPICVSLSLSLRFLRARESYLPSLSLSHSRLSSLSLSSDSATVASFATVHYHHYHHYHHHRYYYYSPPRSSHRVECTRLSSFTTVSGSGSRPRRSRLARHQFLATRPDALLYRAAATSSLLVALGDTRSCPVILSAAHLS